MTFSGIRRLAHDAGYTRHEAAALLGMTERELSAQIKQLDPHGHIAWPGELIQPKPKPRQIAGFAIPTGA